MRAILPETVSLIFDENGTEDLQSELLCIVGNLIDAEIQEGKLEDIVSFDVGKSNSNGAGKNPAPFL